MGDGYTRTDTSNNIANGNVIDADDLDGEFNAIESAFNSSTGHTHDGTSAEGAPIEVTGPNQEYVSDATALYPKADNTYDLGKTGAEWKDLYIDGTANIDSLVADTADINGGTIDGTVIGGTTAAAGSFTTVSATSSITVGGTVDGRDVAADGSKLDGIESNADVTDTANVTAAGALMDSELTDIAAVKALDQGVATTDSPTFSAATISGDLTVDTDTLYVDSANNRVGIGTSSPATNLEISDSSAAILRLTDSGSSAYSQIRADAGTLQLDANAGGAAVTEYISMRIAGSEAMRIESSGNVGIGTSSPTSELEVNGDFRAKTSGSPSILLEETDVASSLHEIFSSGGNLFISGDVNGLGSNMVFRVNGSTEAMRIDSSGNLLVGKTVNTLTQIGVACSNTGYLQATRDGGQPFTLNRQTNDGGLATLLQDDTQEGSISVSGTTVSYNGGHLSRWSRLSDGTDDTHIYKGTVMTNLDEMVEWRDEQGDLEDNEQLNKTTVSSEEGDPNVAGLFVAWDEDDDWGDYYLAMTGDLVVRIAQGVTVQRGDLLMSAGDGTAKPQGDDIVRSKTVAKVTSTNISHTYPDGSYAVPCVVMAS